MNMKENVKQNNKVVTVKVIGSKDAINEIVNFLKMNYETAHVTNLLGDSDNENQYHLFMTLILEGAKQK